MGDRQKFTLEFPVRCSPTIMWEYISSPAGLQEWFADKANVFDGIYSFTWSGGAPEKASLVEFEEFEYIRFQWLNSDPEEYFEFRIHRTEISYQTVLLITDFANKEDIKDQTQLWKYQVKDLFHRLGA